MTNGALLLWAVAGVYLNAMLIGPVVWWACDDAERSLFKWYESCPTRIAWWAQPLVVSLWPVAVAFVIYSKLKERD